MGRAPCCDKSTVKKGPWSPAEDLRLISFIQKHGHPNWRSLPKQAGLLRCGKSCRLRWINYLRPDVKRGNFTPEEEEAIIKLHASFGNKWSTIASQLPGRTDNEIKNVWNTHLKKRLLRENSINSHKDDDDDDDDDQAPKDPSINSSASSSSSSTTSNVSSCGDPNIEKSILGDQDDGFVDKGADFLAPILSENEPKEAASTSSSSSSSIVSNSSNFEGLLGEVFDPMFETIGSPLMESDIDIWSILDNLDSFEGSSDQAPPQEYCHEAPDDSGGKQLDNKEDQYREWFRILENELGLVGTNDEENQNNSQRKSAETLREEMILKPEVDDYFPVWPSSPHNFGF